MSYRLRLRLLEERLSCGGVRRDCAQGTENVLVARSTPLVFNARKKNEVRVRVFIGLFPYNLLVVFYQVIGG